MCISVQLLLGTPELGQNVYSLKLHNSRNIDDVDADEDPVSSRGPPESPGKKNGHLGG